MSWAPLASSATRPPPEAPHEHPLLVASLVTLVLGAAVHGLPGSVAGTLVGAVFLGATWWRVWRFDDAWVTRHGLTLGGLVVPGTPWSAVARRVATAFAWALGLMAIVAVPFSLGFVAWHELRAATPSWPSPWWSPGRSLLLQLALVAFPEEAFYRGYLQTELQRYDGRTVRVLGADVGGSLVWTSVIFALGHVVTVPAPARLAVFFPSLLFGWLRLRTRGIGAGLVFHALCNVLSETLSQSFSPPH